MPAAAPSEAVAGHPTTLESPTAAASTTGAAAAPRTSRTPLVIAGAVALLLAIVMLAMQLWPARDGEAGREREATRQPSGADRGTTTSPSAVATPAAPTVTPSPPSATGTPVAATPDRAPTETAPATPPPGTGTPTSTPPTTTVEAPAQAPAASPHLPAPEPRADASRSEDAAASPDSKTRRTGPAEVTANDARAARTRPDAPHAEPPVVKPTRTPNFQARCSDILQKASLEPLTADEKTFLERECR
jgi:hypothetical protein